MTRKEFRERYRMSGNLTRKRVLKYLPFLLMTNLSNLLLISVDGIVVGNFCGSNALSSVNIFYPITIAIGVISTIISTGIATSLSVCMGENDQDGIARLKHAAKLLMILSSVFIAVFQIPIVYFLINSYHLSEEMHNLTWAYATGVMISMPFGIISTIGVYELQIVGKMKPLMVLSIIEGVINLVMDLLLVGAFRIGIAGAGYGTAIANVIRATLTVIILYKQTEIFDCRGKKSTFKDILNIITTGIPEASFSAVIALTNYLMTKIILMGFGETGGSILGVCSFTLNLSLVFINGLQGSMRPLAGLLSGSNDWVGLRLLLQQCCLIAMSVLFVYTVLVFLFPGVFFHLHGIKEMSGEGAMSLKLFSTCFIFRGVNALDRLYFISRGKKKFSSLLTTFGGLTLPLFALLLIHTAGNEFLWLSYLFTEALICIVYSIRYFRLRKEDKTEDEKYVDHLYMTVEPHEAIEASRSIRQYAKDRGLSDRIAYRISLCLEEMVSYAVASQKSDKINIQIVIRFREDGAVFMMIDDGECISLDADQEKQALITDNYKMMAALAKTVKYQYILDMNYTIFTF